MDPEKIIDVVQALDPLSDLPRTGWLLRGVRPCESIAEHCWGVALVAMMLVDALRAGGAPVDGERVLRMAILHDAPEARTGDVPMPSKTPEVVSAMHDLEMGIAREILSPEQLAVFEEVEGRSSVEARIVKAADKIQMMIKALTYEQQGRGQLSDFWVNPANFADLGIAPASAVFEAIARRAGRPVPGG